MRSWKAIVAVIAPLAATVAAAYGSAYAINLFLGLDDQPLRWDNAWRYYHALDQPRVALYAWRIKLGIAAGCVPPFLACCAAWAKLIKHRSSAEPTHGDARFATLADVRKAGLLKRRPESILIGKYKGHYLWLGGAQHIISISPTRSGKTTSLAIPVLLTYQHSIVVLDLKGELHKTTSGQRRAMGQDVLVWAPYDEHGHTHRFNPMTLLAGMAPAKRIGELQTIAAILYPDQPGTDPFWITQARAAFTAFASCMFEAWDGKHLGGAGAHPSLVNTLDDFPSFERILRFSSGSDGETGRDMLNNLLRDSTSGHLSPQTRTVFANLAGLAEETFSSVIAAMQAPLQQFLSPILAAATNATDFDIRSLRKAPTTLYVNIPTNKLDESSKLLNIFFSTVIGNNLDKQLGEEPDLKYQMLMLMDEFTAMGRVDVWAKRISIAASYGVRDLCIVQSRAQLSGTYGENDAQNFITNHGAQIVFAPREQTDANAYSEMLGYRTVRKKQRSTSHGGSGRQVSTSHIEERRALLLPQEIKELPADEELVFYEGCKPIRARKNWFFKDKAFQQLASMPPAAIRRRQEPDAIPEVAVERRPKSGRARTALSQRARRTSTAVA
ncbi:type IV secretory system conjugative DNA transfer family protein [Luteibacter jiangsuensis]|uniref:Type IV secretory system conjugative DNA transfer family protein n=1 Tax=Luteibacter jiangsuensis TaxID=637577 RepID=A0ABX0Q439_9GAMM|nr:type IV secretory system conjugative DNA transfer family protein [Luteibacter jiangsuensis]NID05290.1 type IV secretory system conjugative DNA transfer family protein [Luteibacter jiangsuensis]